MAKVLLHGCTGRAHPGKRPPGSVDLLSGRGLTHQSPCEFVVEPQGTLKTSAPKIGARQGCIRHEAGKTRKPAQCLPAARTRPRRPVGAGARRMRAPHARAGMLGRNECCLRTPPPHALTACCCLRQRRLLSRRAGGPAANRPTACQRGRHHHRYLRPRARTLLTPAPTPGSTMTTYAVATP